MGVSRPMAPAGPPTRMGEPRRWVPAGLAGHGRASNLAISCPDPNSHVVCLTDWLVNRTLRNFLLSFNDKHWAEVSRNLCLLGVLCLKHLAANPDFVWGNYELAELVDYIQREHRWPEELTPETRCKGQKWVAPWRAVDAVDTAARLTSPEREPVAQPRLHHHDLAPRQGDRSVSATDARRRRPSAGGGCSASRRRQMQTAVEPHRDRQVGSPFHGLSAEAGSRASNTASSTAGCHYSQCGDLLSPRPTSKDLHPDELRDASFFSEAPVSTFSRHAIISAEPQARVRVGSSQRQQPDLEPRRVSSSAVAAPQPSRISRAPSAPAAQSKARRARRSETHGCSSKTAFVQQAAGQHGVGQSFCVGSQELCHAEGHDGAARPHSRLVLADHALQDCSELCEPRLARGGWCADVPFHDDDTGSVLAAEERRRELSSAHERNYSCGRSAASTTAPIAFSESQSASESPSSTLSSGLSLGSPCAVGRGSSMR